MFFQWPIDCAVWLVVKSEGELTTGSKALVSLFPMPDSSTPCKARVGELHVRVSTCVPRLSIFWSE